MLRLLSVNPFKKFVSRFSIGHAESRVLGQLPNVSSSIGSITRVYSSGPSGPSGSNFEDLQVKNNDRSHVPMRMVSTFSSKQNFKQKIVNFYNLPYPIKEELYVNGLYGILFVGSVMVFTGLITDIGYLAAIGFGMIGFPIVIVSLGLSTGIYLYRKLIGRDKSLKDIAL